MNKNHSQLCPSPERSEYLHTEILPTGVRGIDLGEDLIEVGPGPGAS
ncbi:MAG: hypothetical protein ACR2NR_04865 [Solirubrobacteraceae bacterium]